MNKQHRRGEEVVFTAGFFEDSQQLVPRPPMNANQPTYDIVDSDNNVLASGVAAPNVTLGFYDVAYTVPDDAPLGPLGRSWRIDWNLVDVGGHSHTYSLEFAVLEKSSEIAAVEKRHGYLVFVGKNAVLLNRRASRPHEITVDVSIPGQPSLETDRQAGALAPEEIIDGSVFAYRDTIAASKLLPDTTYAVLWEITQTPASFPVNETEVLHVLSKAWIPYLHAFDVVINKIRARATDLQAATPYEQFNALKEGLKIVNGWHPNTVQWTMDNFPHGTLGHFVVLAAQFWWLNSLYQAEGLLSFDFSGQTVSLTYDHLGWIDASMQRALDFLNNQLAIQKKAVQRRAMPTGIVAVRPMRYGSFRDHHIFKLSSASAPNNVLDLLVGFGLI